MSVSQPRLRYSSLDDIEDLEQYRPGGFHPVSIGDTFAGGRYKVVHKLGNGGSSTVWLAQDQHLQEHLGNLVTLKVMSAEQSSEHGSEIADLYIPQELRKFSRTTDHVGTESLYVVRDYFFHKGPNGSHLCLISELAGPSILAMLGCQGSGRVSGTRRLRGDLARKIAMQMARALEFMHSAGIVHGDVTSSNVLFRVSDKVQKWSVDEFYQTLGSPEMEEVHTYDGSPPDPFVPQQVVAPVDISLFSSPWFLKEEVVLIDFGSSFFANRPPPDYTPATQFCYLSPEGYFDSKASFASDVWALACTIFEIRAGSHLFDPLSGGNQIFKQVVDEREARRTLFDETGVPKPVKEARQEEVLLPTVKDSLRQKLHDIGAHDDDLYLNEGAMIEKTGTRLEEAEVELLAGLLVNMLRYHPEDRISMTEVVRHPWFAYVEDTRPNGPFYSFY